MSDSIYEDPAVRAAVEAQARAERERDEALRARDQAIASLLRDGVGIDHDVEGAVAEAIASVDIEWDQTPDPAPDWLVAPVVAAVRPALVKALQQRDRYRAAWTSARRRARRHRQARDDWERADERAAEWNRLHPVGTRVAAYPETLIDVPLQTWTRTPAWTLGDGTPVVSVEGVEGAICLDHVRPTPGGGEPVDELVRMQDSINAMLGRLDAVAEGRTGGEDDDGEPPTLTDLEERLDAVAEAVESTRAIALGAERIATGDAGLRAELRRMAERIDQLEVRASAAAADPRVDKIAHAIGLDPDRGTSHILAAIQRTLGDLKRTGGAR